ncbi:MAG TPA: MFS transporter [Stellaceae bacterium]|nr:MFS transporter [Stellaceae bacterium]
MSTAAAARPQDGKIIGLVSAAHFMSHFYQLVLPSLFPILKSAFGVDYATLGVVMTLMYATSALMQTPAGVLVDRLGATRVLIGGLGLYASAVTLYGFAPNIWVLGLLAVVAGFGNCVFHPSDYAIMTARVGAGRLGRAYGVHNLGGSFGWVAAPVSVLALTSLFGWRAALSILGGVGLVLTAYLILERAALKTEGRTPEPRPGAGRERAPLPVFLSRPILLCFGYFLLLAVANAGLQPFLPSSLVAAYGLSVAVANSALSGYLIGSSLGIFTGGVAADRFGRPELIVAFGLASAGGLALVIGFVPMPVPPLVLCVAAAGFCAGGTTPSRDMLVRRAAPAGATGKVFGFVYSGLDLGSAITPPFLGLLIDHQLPRFVFVAVAAALFLAISTAFVVGTRSAGEGTPGGRRDAAAAMPP